MATYQRVGVIVVSTGLVETVFNVDIDDNPPSGWPANWITSTGKVNEANPGYTYVPLFNGFVPPQPYPTFILDTTTLTWEPDPTIYYYWTYPVEQYYNWSPSLSGWVPVDLPPGGTIAEITIIENITYALSRSAATVYPGETIEVGLTISGPWEPSVVPYTVTGTTALEDVKQIYEYTVRAVPGSSPVQYNFARGVGLPFTPLLSKGNSFTFDQSDPSNDGNTLLLSENFNGTHAPGGLPYEVGVMYFLDNVQVADLTAYLAGFDAAITRYLTITTDPNLVPPIFLYSHQTAGFTGEILLWPLSLNKFEGVFFAPSQAVSTLYITVEPLFVPAYPVVVTVDLETYTDQVEQISFTILPPP